MVAHQLGKLISCNKVNASQIRDELRHPVVYLAAILFPRIQCAHYVHRSSASDLLYTPPSPAGGGEGVDKGPGRDDDVARFHFWTICRPLGPSVRPVDLE